MEFSLPFIPIHTSPPPFGIAEVMAALAGVLTVAVGVWRLWCWSRLARHPEQPHAAEGGTRASPVAGT